ncbi:MAG: FtsX-like permease family protein [Sedimentisphaerales bacterium]|nr:FtsX-like permease family protein [Sedimentisphaerales bacterium]
MYKFKLALRYLIKRKISYFAVIAVALCVFIVFVVITVLTGITADFKGKIHDTTGDCVVYTKSLVGFGHYDEFIRILRRQDFIEEATPVVKNYAMVSIAESGGLGSYGDYTKEIAGIEPVSLAKVTGFGDWIEYNKGQPSKVFTPSYDVNLPGCVPGIGFLFEKDEEGNYHTPAKPPRAAYEVACIPLNAKGAPAKAGAGELSSKTFYYSDHFSAGYSLDWRLFFLPLEDVQLLCGMGTGHKRITHIHIKFTKGTALNSGTEKVKKLWSDFVDTKKDAPYANLLKKVQVQDWKNFSKMIVALVETQQILTIVCFGMIGVITVFIVLVVFYMIVSHKSKDIGILKSVGASGINILGLFLNFALLIGIVGSAIGSVSGWIFLLRINEIEDWMFNKFQFQIWDRRISSIGDIPNAIDLKVLSIIIACAIAACLVGALLPSWRASRMKCVDTLAVTQL